MSTTIHQQTKQNKKQAFLCYASLKAQTLLCGVVVPCYQYHSSGGVIDNKVPQIHTTLSKPLD